MHNLSFLNDEFSLYLKSINELQRNKIKLNSRTLNPNAIIVAQAMLEVFQPKNIIVSIFGLKEGVRYELLPEIEKNQDIVLQKVIYCCQYEVGQTNFDKYYEIIEPLVEESNDLSQILKLAIILQSLNKYFDQTLSPTAISEFILNSEIPFTHRQRLMIALILSYSSNFKPDIELIKISKKLLCRQDFKNSQILGYFIRIAKDIDGFNFTEPSFNITIKNSYLEIITKDILPRPIFESICNKLKSIAYIRKISSD